MYNFLLRNALQYNNSLNFIIINLKNVFSVVKANLGLYVQFCELVFELVVYKYNQN